MLGVGAQFAALIRILAEYLRLRRLPGHPLSLAQADLWIEGALMTTVLLAAATFPAFFGRYRLSLAVAVATIVILLLFKAYLVATGRLPGWW